MKWNLLKIFYNSTLWISLYVHVTASKLCPIFRIVFIILVWFLLYGLIISITRCITNVLIYTSEKASIIYAIIALTVCEILRYCHVTILLGFTINDQYYNWEESYSVLYDLAIYSKRLEYVCKLKNVMKNYFRLQIWIRYVI